MPEADLPQAENSYASNYKGDLMKKSHVISIAALALISFILPARSEQETRRSTKLDKPTPDMSAADLMKINYVIKYTKFLDDMTINKLSIYYISRSGGKRFRSAKRLRVTLNRPKDDLDYKDIVVITSPENVKGLAVLTWSYINPKRQREQWLWLPSLKKVRRTSPADGDDAFLGSDFTTEDVTSRRWEDETYKKLKDEVFPGCTMKLDNKLVNKDVDCYVIECVPKKKNWCYAKRKVYLSKEIGGNIFEEIYDQKGNILRTITRVYKMVPGGPLQIDLEAYDPKTRHATHVNNQDWEVNKGLSEHQFTGKNLMRTKW